MAFYYDQLMNDDTTTFSIYWYNTTTKEMQDDKEVVVYNSSEYGARNYKLPKSTEILRGVISQNASMGTQILWNGSPLNLTSAWANLASNLKSTSRNLQNASKNIINTIDTVTSPGGGKVLNWNQDAYYSINEFQKTFGGMTTSTPLTVSSIILPYIDKNNRYIDVKKQLDTFLSAMYPDESIKTGETFDDAYKSDEGFLGTLKSLLAKGANWLSNALDSVGESIFGSNEKYVLTIKPPHDYSGVPTDFVENQWMANTLALRIGNRQLYNLLISSITVTVSKELTYYKDTLAPTQAQIDLSFQPVLILKPSEIKEYVLMTDVSNSSGGTS